MFLSIEGTLDKQPESGQFPNSTFSPNGDGVEVPALFSGQNYCRTDASQLRSVGSAIVLTTKQCWDFHPISIGTKRRIWELATFRLFVQSSLYGQEH